MRVTDGRARVAEAREAASSEGKPFEGGAKALRTVATGADERTANILRHLARLESKKKGTTVTKDVIERARRFQARLSRASQGVSSDDPEKMIRSFKEMQSASQDLTDLVAALDVRLSEDDSLRAQFDTEELSAFGRMVDMATAIDAQSRAIVFAVQHQDLMGDAAPHERPAGPDEAPEGEDGSFKVVPVSELMDGFSDLVDHGIPEVTQFDPTPARAPEPAPAPTPAKPAVQRKPKPAKPFPVADKPAEPETKEPEAPAAEPSDTPARTMAQAKSEIRAEVERRGQELKPGWLKQASELLHEEPDQSAADILDALGDQAITARTRETRPEPTADAPAEGRKPAAVASVADAVSGISIPSNLKRETKDQVERWRSDMRSKIKDEKARAKAEKDLASALSSVKGDTPALRAADAGKKLQRWAKKHNMMEWKSGYFDRMMRGAGAGAGNARAEDVATAAGSSTPRSNNFGGMMARGNKGSGKRPPIAGDKDWRRGMKKQLRLKPNPLRLPLNDEPSE